MHKRLTLALGLLTLGSAATAQGNYALDPTFANAGKFNGPATGAAAVYPLWSSSQPDGKILASGAFYNPTTGAFDSAAVFRLKPNGTLDSTFGTAGYARARFSNPTGVAAAVKVLPGGKLAIAGYSFTSGANPVFTGELTMLDATGHIDPAFNGGNAVVLGGTAAAPGFTFGMDVQSTGQIVVSATIGQQPSAASTAKIFRYNANGTPDATFGTGGSITITPGYIDQLFVEANDRIMTDWSDGSMSGNVAKAILRYTAAGQPDATWGTAGKSDTIMENTTSNNAYSMSITPLANGKYALSSLGVPGATVPATQAYVTRRFTGAGHLDAAYGTGGKAALTITGFDRSSDYYTVANGNKVIAMLDLPSTTTQGTRDFVLLQTDTAGALDNTFGPAGMLRTPAGNSTPLALNKLSNGTLIGAADLYGYQGGLIRFAQTPTGLAFINGRMAASVYPNPATAFATLRCESGVRYAVYDLTGKEVLRGTTTGTETILSTQNLAPGAYSLVCTDGTRNADMRLIKQ